jgi:hypothetical protein
MHEYHMFVLEEDDVRGYLSEVKGEGIIKSASDLVQCQHARRS